MKRNLKKRNESKETSLYEKKSEEEMYAEHVERDLHKSKETCTNKNTSGEEMCLWELKTLWKMRTWGVRNMSKETYTNQKRPVQIKINLKKRCICGS